MKATETKTAITSARNNNPFFQKESNQLFFSDNMVDRPFFTKKQNTQPLIQAKPLAAAIRPQIQTKCATCEEDDKMVQRQEQPDETVTKTDTPDANESPATIPKRGFSRAGKCNTSPEFPNFRCLTTALKLDIDENLWNNAPQFYRAASLYPGDNDLMWNTFLRYGVGVNLLKTSFGFLGAGKTLGTALSYGTGIGLKSYDFFKNGKLEIDYQYNLGKDLNLDFKLDLNADPNDLTNVKGVNTGIGISGHFQ